MRLIDADEFINTTKMGTMLASMCTTNVAKKEILKATYELIKERIGNAPTVDAVPVRHGKWKYKNDEDFDYVPCCSICGEADALSRNDYNYHGGKIRDNNSNYCPTCGAKMDGGESK
ncbi:MAG: hypothetical protein K2O29_01365 [Ruminococcus sp.]|nr:hypothetical protein [Ruminococcus sp.]MDE6847800.1 hypothetical protein [Ruminococcus sp.]MDE7137096.1 hypothetical protein [Ruminococcus sp.]